MAPSIPKMLLLEGKIISTSTPRMATTSSAVKMLLSGRKYGVTTFTLCCAQANAPNTISSILP